MLHTVALVPMRHESERVPGKNYRALGDRPLFHHVIAMLLSCPGINKVVIDTDSPVIREDARHTFPSVTVLERPQHLRDGAIPMNDVLLHDVRVVPGDLYLQTHSTNPFLRAETVVAALDAFAASQQNDSLFGVTRLETRLWRGDATPINHDPARLVRTQDLEPVYEENSCIYLFTREVLQKHGSRIGERPLLFEIPPDEALDIDTEQDFRIAEALHRVGRPS